MTRKEKQELYKRSFEDAKAYYEVSRTITLEQVASTLNLSWCNYSTAEGERNPYSWLHSSAEGWNARQVEILFRLFDYF